MADALAKMLCWTPAFGAPSFDELLFPWLLRELECGGVSTRY